MVLLADDLHLVRAAQAGDDRAFEELVLRHQLPAYRVALRMLGRPQDAEEAAQDALVQAWRALAAFRAESSFSTWLYRIVTNRCLTMLAARRPQQPLDEIRPDPAGGPDERAEARARFGALKGAVLTLTPEQRAVLVLREFEGLAYVEIGAVLDLTEPAVKGRLHRARLELAREMREWR